MPKHRMTIEDDDGRDIVFACAETGCGRRVVFRRSGGMAVLDRGDFFAQHFGGSEGLQIGADLG